eukprot:3616701-Prymnesium_polylepis.1
MAPRKGTKAPGISPCPFGSRRTDRRPERPPPSAPLGANFARPRERVTGFRRQGGGRTLAVTIYVPP